MTIRFSFLNTCFLGFSLLFSGELAIADLPATVYPVRKVAIIGGGIIGALESYYAFKDAMETGIPTELVVYEKDASFEKQVHCGQRNVSTNTAYNISASLTADEILSVVPRGRELVEKLAVLFSEPGGIRVDDVPGANDSPTAVRFKEAVELYGQDQNHDDRTKSLLALGKLSMDSWQRIYEEADEELKQIMKESNYHACQQPKNDQRMLDDGYRIDLIYDVLNAQDRAKGMQATYEQLGYDRCKVLTPAEVMAIDPFLTDFCMAHSEIENGELIWKNDCTGLWRPGGCLSTRVFLPKFYAYLKKAMGTYLDGSGEAQDCFRIEFEKEVTAVEFDNGSDLRISGLKFADGSLVQDLPSVESHYVFCPGEAVGTLRGLGFEEPDYAGFAGPSLLLNIPLSPEQIDSFKTFNHCMEVHKVGIVLAWQARFKEDRLIIGVAGTKAFYGSEKPNLDQNFAQNRHLVQLNMINDVLPEMVSIGCGFDTKGMHLQAEHINLLENQCILERWVGRRAVAYDGYPTLGALYCKGIKVENARCTTHLGSGGVSFSPAAVQMSRRCEAIEDALTEKVLRYADSRRRPS